MTFGFVTSRNLLEQAAAPHTSTVTAIVRVTAHRIVLFMIASRLRR
jgi:hypothetical protein